MTRKTDLPDRLYFWAGNLFGSKRAGSFEEGLATDRKVHKNMVQYAERQF